MICSETRDTLIPRAYVAMIFPSTWLLFSPYFGTTCASKSLFRSCCAIMSELAIKAASMLDMLPQTEQQSAFETLKRIVPAWDADFVKVTPAEAAALDAAEAEIERGKMVSDADIDWDAD